MPAASWPADLPDYLLVSGFTKGLGDGRLRSEMDAGPAKIRLRSASTPRPLSGALRMSSAQVLAAEAFVTTDLRGGSLPFYFPDPLTRDPILVRFVDLPSHSCVGGDWYDLTMSLEILP